MTQPTNPAPDSQPLVGASEAASMMGIELSTFSHLRRREETVENSKFPKPMAVLRCGPIWKTGDIRKYALKYESPRPGPKPIEDDIVSADKVVPAPRKAPAKPNGVKVAAKKAPAVKKAAPVKAAAKPVAAKAPARKVAPPIKKALKRAPRQVPATV